MPDKIKPNIKIERLSVIYNKSKSNEVRALENVSLEIFPQEYVVIYGPSGCGKSTLLYCISALQRPTAGTVVIEGQDINKYNKENIAKFRETIIGMIFQAFYLIPSINCLDNVCLPKVFSGEDCKKREENALKLFKRFRIEDQIRKFPSALSGGQKQRVSIARSLINNPNIILADEPVGNLDSVSAYNVMTILQELNQRDKKTVVLVTHDKNHLRYADKIIHMKDGKIIKIETFRKRKKEVVDSYLFKGDKLKETLVRQGLEKGERISDDLLLLMRAFRNLKTSQIGAMIVPFKVEQLFSHILSSMTDEQIETAKKNLQEVLFGRESFDDFGKKLDSEIEKGGAGWDKRVAARFSKEALEMVRQAKRVDYTNLEDSALSMRNYLIEKLDLKLNDEKKKDLASLVLDRLNSKIGVNETEKIIDMPEEKGGLGLDKRTAQKIAREIEVLLLLRYSASNEII